MGFRSLSVFFSCFLEISPCRPCFCAIWGGARCTIHTRLCMFCKGSPNQTRLTFQTLLGYPDTHKRGQTRWRRAGEGPRVAPETLDSYQNDAQAPCREAVKNYKWKCQKLEGNVASEGKMLINTSETSSQQVSCLSDLEEHGGAQVEAKIELFGHPSRHYTHLGPLNGRKMLPQIAVSRSGSQI